MKKLSKKELISYLLTLQLLKAGYEITYDEVMEQVGIKEFLSVPKEDRELYFKGKISIDWLRPKYKWYDYYTITVTQEKEWFVEAVKIIKHHLGVSEYQALREAGYVSLMQGLKLKGK